MERVVIYVKNGNFYGLHWETSAQTSQAERRNLVDKSALAVSNYMGLKGFSLVAEKLSENSQMPDVIELTFQKN